MWPSARYIIRNLLLGVPFGITVIDLFGYVAKVEGSSMQPMLNPVITPETTCDYVFLYNWPITANAYDQIERGDVIALISPKHPKQRLIKRVIGIPGDVLKVDFTLLESTEVIQVPKGHLWVEGDHRGRSFDSTVFGPAALGLVKSKARAVVWPPARWQLIRPHMLPDRIPINLQKVDCIEVKFSGKVLKEGVCLGDCNNDGLGELVVGNTDGEMFIYRGTRCICKSTDLGTISAAVVGDLLNISKNVVVIISVEGWCHLFDIEYELNLDDVKDDISSTDASASISEMKIIQPFHSQRIVANIKSAKMGDVNNDGKTELVVGLTDRVLRTYQWTSELDNFEESDKLIEGDDKTTDDQRSDMSDFAYNGKLKAINKWEFAEQIGSVAIHKQGKSTCILVGQPGGTVSKISHVKPTPQVSTLSVEKPRSRNVSSSSSNNQFDLEHFSLNLGNMRNPSTSTEVVGNIFPFEAGQEADYYAVSTLDGMVMLCHEDSFEIVIQLETPILALESCNGSFVIVAWDGTTYLVKRTISPDVADCITLFNFEENVASFKVGPYGFPQNPADDDGTRLQNQNCFVFATFHESIYIYTNEHL